MVSPLPPPYGGISHWTKMLCQYANTCENVQLYVVDIAPHWRPMYDLGIWKRVVGGSIQFLRDIIQFCAILLVRCPHVVHLTTSGRVAIFRDLGIMLVAKLFHVPVIYHIRFGRVPTIASENSYEWKLIAYTMHKAHIVIAIDYATQNVIRHHFPEIRLVRIPNCINMRNLQQHNGKSNSEHTVVFLGRIIPTKGISELIDAWTRLRPCNWRLRIIGLRNRAYQEKLLALYNPERVEFSGEMDHDKAMKCLAEADVFVFPSYTEGFPNVVLEAMALGKAIIASRVGAIPEMLADGCGLLIDPKDSEALADALAQVFEDDTLRFTMGIRARIRAMDKFSIDTVFKQYMTIWHHAAGIE